MMETRDGLNIMCMLVAMCGFSLMLAYSHSYRFDDIDKQLQQIEANQTEIIENIKAIEQDSFYSNE